MSEHGLYDHGYDIHQMGWGNDGGDADASVASSSSSVSSGEEERISVRRKRKNRGRKEEALYGVFATNDSHDTDNKHDGGTRRQKKHFTSGTVAFVKAAAAKQDATTATPDNEDNNDTLMMDATTTTPATMTTLEQDEWDELAESELNTNAMNAKFTQLLERSTTSTIPTMTAVLPTTTPLEPMTSISTTNIQPPLEETKQLELEQHANENEDAFDQYRNEQKKSKSGFGLGYKPSSSSFPSSTNKDSVPTMETTNDDDTTAAASVVTTRNQEERTTWNKKGNGKKLLELADLASFFTSAQAQPPQQSNPMKNAPKKDPNLGTWEKHTKGIGYKLLIKMGYEGSGGLGSKRRRRITTTPTPTTGATTTTTNTATTTTTTTASNENADATSMKKGISRPVEVVVRPANLGLGFGNFTEATRLKGNIQIEAEVRGIDWKKQEQEKNQKQQEERKRLLPTTQDLLAHATDWKKQPHTTNNNKRRREKRKIISYQELVSTEEKEAKNNATTGSSKLHIIDMRGPTSLSAVPSLNADGTVPLGEELLHNVTLLLNTMENHLLSTSHLARSTKQRVSSLQSDVHAMTQRIQDAAHRRAKLQTVLRIMDDIDALQTQTSNHDNDDDDHINIMTQVQGYIQKLHDNFTKEEKESLHFYNVLVPCLLGPFVEKRLVQWDPLGNSPFEHDQMMTSVWNLSPSPLTGQMVPSTGDESKWFTRRSIFVNHILPRAKRALQSSQWDPMSTVDDGLELYEAMLKGAAMASPPPMVSQSREEMEDVLLEAPMEQLYTSVDSVKEELMHETIYPKMSRSISAWKPVIDKKQQSLGECRLVNPLHLWVLPWLPHLDHKTILPTLLGDIKRKLRSSLSYLQGAKGIHETDFLSASFVILEPWRGILEKTILQDLTSNSVVPRLDKYLCNMVISRESKDQDWSSVDVLFKWHAAGLLSDRELMSLVEGEVLCTWARALHAWLSLEESSEPTANFEQMSEFYADWKQKLLLDTQHGEKADGARVVPACQILRKDKMICQHFYACLLMIQSKMDNDADALDDLLPPFRESYNYRHAMARRVRDERIKEQEKEILQHGTGPAPRHFHKPQQHTFREVVEDYAREQNVSFTPRLGANSTKDGKPIFMFGTTPIYIDSNVVFALRESKWQPTSLETLS
eukprot:scaffold47215_cov51-Attheya_sp.AAC.7